MYETRFGFRRRPFPATPDSRTYYPATSHERALALLQRTLDDGDSIALLTGAPGTGKTLVCHCLLERLGEGIAGAFLTNSHFSSRSALLQAILYDLSLPYEGAGEQELRLRLTDFLLSNYRAGRRTVIVVDEAQHLGPDLLEELRLLGNLEGGRGRAVQVVLAGQPGLLETLRLPELAAFNQRVLVRARLDPLGVEEAIDYLLHHLRAAGGRPERVITEDSLELLARHTAGVPRLLNQVAHQALALADSADASLVDAEAALEALALIGLEVAEEAVAPLADDVPSGAPEMNLVAEEPAEEAAPAVVAEPGKEGANAEAVPLEDASEAYLLFEAPRRPA
jgi:type II secretory pathway predicted ATPase ExeA